MAPAALLPIVFFLSLHGARKREFAADSGAVELTGDGRSQPLQFGALVEWFSTHPSTYKRIRAIAAKARLESAEVDTLCASDNPGEKYVLPLEDQTAIFTIKWQAANAARFGWAMAFGSAASGILTALLVGRLPGAGLPIWIGGVALACAMTKLASQAVMACGYARIGRKLKRKLESDGQLVGLAAGDQPRLYGGYRFRDLGFLSIEGARLSYRSERTSIELAPADIVGCSEKSSGGAIPALKNRQAQLQSMDLKKCPANRSRGCRLRISYEDSVLPAPSRSSAR